MENSQPVLIAGKWRPSAGADYFQSANPQTGVTLPENYPVSPWPEIEEAIEAAADAFQQLRQVSPDAIAAFLDKLAVRIENRREEFVQRANQETALPAEPRLNSVELPRTTNQLRLAAKAARERSWSQPVIDSGNNIRSFYKAIGPVCVFGPNNFPFAFNSAAGGDFAAAIAAGNPVIAKANTSHPGTTRLFAEEALEAAKETGLPTAMVQLLYRASHADGARLVAHPLIGATGYTGSRRAGLALKEAADKAGKPIYLELSSINPVVILPGALEERTEALAEEFVGSVLMGTGQFCTNPGLILLLENEQTSALLEDLRSRFSTAPAGTLLGSGVEKSLLGGIEALKNAGAEVVVGGNSKGEARCSVENTLLKVDGDRFLANPEALQEEAFGNASLIVTAADTEKMIHILNCLEGNLTGCIYSHSDGRDDVLYGQVEPVLRGKVGRLLNDKMPTGVLVSPAMNHGGPYPATGHPGFTAVGIPASLIRFAVLHCYDNVRPDRLPPELQNANPTGQTWRSIDGQWTCRDVSEKQLS